MVKYMDIGMFHCCDETVWPVSGGYCYIMVNYEPSIVFMLVN
jgi:hypothetical protein